MSIDTIYWNRLQTLHDQLVKKIELYKQGMTILDHGEAFDLDQAETLLDTYGKKLRQGH